MALPRNVLVPLVMLALLICASNAQLSTNFYATTCPNLQRIVRTAMAQAIRSRNPGPRISASILRLFFHDCFVNGCDASVLLDDTATFTGEKNAFPNRNSARGFEVIDIIKTRVDAACNSSVSCADILAMATREGVILLGGPTWDVFLGRRDARTASQSDANSNLPAPSSSLAALISSFANHGLSERDMVALSGGHTLGFSQCNNFRTRIYNETNINPGFANIRRRTCPATRGNGDANLAPFDNSQFSFDNNYFQNLVARRGLLHSDQELFNGGSSDQIVQDFANSPRLFRDNFSAAMVRMGNIRPLTGNSGEIRRNCRFVN